jgi:hypothetical protein
VIVTFPKRLVAIEQVANHVGSKIGQLSYRMLLVLSRGRGLHRSRAGTGGDIRGDFSIDDEGSRLLLLLLLLLVV